MLGETNNHFCLASFKGVRHDRIVHYSWIFNYLAVQSMPITTEVVSSNSAQARCTRYNGYTSFFHQSITRRHDIAEILLKVVLSTIKVLIK